MCLASLPFTNLHAVELALVRSPLPSFFVPSLICGHTSTPRDAQARARQSPVTPASSSSQSSGAGGSMPSQSLGGARASGSGCGSNRMLRRKGLVHEPSHDSNQTPTIDDAFEACRDVGHGRERFEPNCTSAASVSEVHEHARLRRARSERIDARGRSQQELFPDRQSPPARTSKSPLAADVDRYRVASRAYRRIQQPAERCLDGSDRSQLDG